MRLVSGVRREGRRHHLTSGGAIEGTVLQENAANLLVKMNYGTITVPRAIVKKVDKTAVPVAAAAPTTSPSGAASAKRIPDWNAVIQPLARQAWATGLVQIPATVIDKGVMRAVPYNSYRCGMDYEVNVYGDPDAPAGIEIGIYRGLLKDPQAKANCIAFVAAILGDRTDAGIVRAANLSKDLITRDGLTIEVTPETAEDAYGGWWVSVYDEKSLDKARASDKELQDITVARGGKPAAPAAGGATASAAPATIYDWQSSDIQRSRPPASASDASGGRVCVRAYTRQDGTYVQAHTRAAPGTGSRGGGRR